MRWGRTRNNPYLDNYFESYIFGSPTIIIPKDGEKNLNVLLLDKYTIKPGRLRLLNEYLIACEGISNLDIVIGIHSAANLERLMCTLQWIITDTEVGDLKSSQLKIYVVPLYKIDEKSFSLRILEEKMNIEICFGVKTWPNTST